jgi:hypothetical protein
MDEQLFEWAFGHATDPCGSLSVASCGGSLDVVVEFFISILA